MIAPTRPEAGAMQLDVNGTRLWFDVDGATLVPEGSGLRQRPTIVLVHAGPGSYDHSYFKPCFGRLTEHAQVVYLDLRGHGRSDWGDAATWSLEACADDVRAFCDALGIARPFVLGHSLGGLVVLLYGARHPGHAAGLVVQSGFVRFDVPRLSRASAASPATRSPSSRGAAIGANRSPTRSGRASSRPSDRASRTRSSSPAGRRTSS
jgi:pimeloyl-ACP methyl ester carboxylesterase